MKTTLFFAVLFLSMNSHPADLQRLESESRQAIAKFSSQLKSKLQQGGPVAAIQVCHAAASAISERISRQYGWKIARTSLKGRNPGNAPDPWERKVLETFEARKAGGEPAQQLSHSEIIEQNGQKNFRYLQAIPTGEICLACHGKNIDPAVQAELDRLYPVDQARGFTVGDLRGAFSID